MNRHVSQNEWVARAKTVFPAGGFGNFEPNVILQRGLGSRVWDEDGKEYVDFLIGSGPMIIGHCHPEVAEVVQSQFAKGTTFFTNNALGIELAEEICRAVACSEQVRYVSTGGEADMYAMRLARAFTGRNKILKFEGGYHGMSAESLMSLAPTKLEAFPQPVPDSAGIPKSVSDHMIIAPFNDIGHVTALIEKHVSDIAAVIVEPFQRLIPPEPGFLKALREITDKHGIVLIFDEVVTGFRFAYGGAQELYSVTPDLCTLGKIIGGGFPLAAIAGRQDIMSHFDKNKVGASRFTPQIGTLSGNPLACAAGLKTMEILRRSGNYEKLRSNGKTIMSALDNTLSRLNIDHQVIGDPVLFDVVFSKSAINDYRSFLSGDESLGGKFVQGLRDRGVLKGPTKFYTSLSLTEQDVSQTIDAIEYAAGLVAELRR